MLKNGQIYRYTIDFSSYVWQFSALNMEGLIFSFLYHRDLDSSIIDAWQGSEYAFGSYFWWNITGFTHLTCVNLTWSLNSVDDLCKIRTLKLRTATIVVD